MGTKDIFNACSKKRDSIELVFYWSDTHGDNFTLDSTYQINSGNESIDVEVYTGFYLGALRMTWHVAANDCSPIAMNNYGQAPGAIVLNTYTFEDVKQGSLRDDAAVELPAECQALVNIELCYVQFCIIAYITYSISISM